jgi:hypothetical protein
MRVSINEDILITIQAKDLYGGTPTLTVEAGQIYSFEVLPNQEWHDAFIRTDADGFFNFLLWFSGRRVKGVKCFTLCGTIGQNEEQHFKIGQNLQHFKISTSGELYFFPNDSIRHYGNNKGSIKLTVRREA